MGGVFAGYSEGMARHGKGRGTYVADGVEGVAFLEDLLRGHAHLHACTHDKAWETISEGGGVGSRGLRGGGRKPSPPACAGRWPWTRTRGTYRVGGRRAKRR